LQPKHALPSFLTALLALPWLQNVSFGPSPLAVQGVLTWCCAAIFCLLCTRTYCSATQREAAIMHAWWLAAVLSAGLGLLQYFGVSGWLWGLASAAEPGQAYGNLRQRNQFATLLAIGWVAVLWHAAPPQPHRGSLALGLRRTSALYLSTAVLAAASAASGSRTGMLQWLAIAGLFWYWSGWSQEPQHRRVLRRLVSLGLLAYALAAFALPAVLNKGVFGSGILSRLQEAAPACASRITLWGNVLQLIAHKPWLGWGWGELDYAFFITPLQGERFCGLVDNAHNLPLQLAVSAGIPFAALVCGLLLGWVAYAKPWRETHATRQMAWAVLAVIGLHSLLEYPLWYAPFQLAALLAFFLWCSVATRPHRILNTTTVRAIATGLLVACALVAYDYWRMSQVYLPLASRSRWFTTDAMQTAQASWLFKDLALFAELTTTPLTKDRAAQVHALALRVVHLSPEPRVIEKLMESATLLGQDKQAVFYLARYQAAFPAESARWRAGLHPVAAADPKIENH
jgi:O-antigen ligase